MITQEFVFICEQSFIITTKWPRYFNIVLWCRITDGMLLADQIFLKPPTCSLNSNYLQFSEQQTKVN